MCVAQPALSMTAAAFWGHAHVIRKLLGPWGMPVEGVDYAGDTALHDAARFGHTEIVGLLLDAGANPIRPNKDGFSALDLAEEHGKADVVKLIRSRIEEDMLEAAASRRRKFLSPPPMVVTGDDGWKKRRNA